MLFSLVCHGESFIQALGDPNEYSRLHVCIDVVVTVFCRLGYYSEKIQELILIECSRLEAELIRINIFKERSNHELNRINS